MRLIKIKDIRDEYKHVALTYINMDKTVSIKCVRDGEGSVKNFVKMADGERFVVSSEDVKRIVDSPI